MKSREELWSQVIDHRIKAGKVQADYHFLGVKTGQVRLLFRITHTNY